MASNQKMQEYKPTLKFNFTIEKKVTSFDFWTFWPSAPISLSPNGHGCPCSSSSSWPWCSSSPAPGQRADSSSLFLPPHACTKALFCMEEGEDDGNCDKRSTLGDKRSATVLYIIHQDLSKKLHVSSSSITNTYRISKIRILCTFPWESKSVNDVSYMHCVNLFLIVCMTWASCPNDGTQSKKILRKCTYLANITDWETQEGTKRANITQEGEILQYC